jgi:hypothetical protein
LRRQARNDTSLGSALTSGTPHPIWIALAATLYGCGTTAPVERPPPVRICEWDCNSDGSLCSLACAGSLTSIGVDDSNLYWTETLPPSAGRVNVSLVELPKYGGVPVTLASGLSGTISAVDSMNVYLWGSPEADPFKASGTERLLSVPIDGGLPTTLAANQNPNGTTFDAAHAYWLNLNAWTEDLLSVPLGGGTISTITTTGASAQGLVVEDGRLYWGDIDNGLISVDVAGGTPRVVAPYLFFDGSLAADHGHICGPAGTITTDFMLTCLPLAGGSPVTLTSAGIGASLQINNGNVYWQWGDLVKAPVSGGTPATLTSVTDFQSWAGFTFDSTSLYWGESNIVYRRTPK